MSAHDLRVLTYHRVVDPADARDCDPALISATPGDFERQVQYLAAHYNVVSAGQVVDARRSGEPLPGKPVWVTFDDACRDFGEIAWPILRRHGVPATVFVPTAYPDHPELRFWWDRLYSAFTETTLGEVRDPDFGRLPLGTAEARRSSRRLVQRRVKAMPQTEAMRAVDRLCGQLGYMAQGGGDTLSWSELRRLMSQGVSVGGHTRSHPALTRMSVEDARREIRGSRDDLQRELGAWLPVFAYPFGDHDDAVVRVAREEGFELAVTCHDGHNGPSADPLRLRRTNITRRTGQVAFRARLTSIGARVDRWRHRHERDEGPRPRAAAAGHRAGPPLKLAYIMSRFPKLSETFILNELLTANTLGVPIEIYPLIRERQRVMHPEVEAWVRRARFQRLFSPGLLLAHAHYMVRQPIEYVGLGAEVLRRTWGSPKFFIGALGTFPKAVGFAYDMQRGGVTHIHAHFATHATVAAFVIHRLTGIPFSFTAHGSDLHVDRRMLDAKVDAASFAVTVSNYNREVMVQTCGERSRYKLHVIHCGVDPQHFVPMPRGASAGRLRLVCVASLETVKGHTYLVEACRILKDRGLDFRCSLAGDGPRRRALLLQVRRAGLEDCVHLLGGQTRPQVARLLADADVAVLASHPTREGKREGIPVALMEAMAAGLPVVSSAISGIPELVESDVTGLLVPSGDPMALAGAIERLDADPVLRERMGRAGRQRICDDFNLETNTRQLLQLFSATPVTERVGASAAVAPPLTSCT